MVDGRTEAPQGDLYRVFAYIENKIQCASSRTRFVRTSEKKNKIGIAPRDTWLLRPACYSKNKTPYDNTYVYVKKYKGMFYCAIYRVYWVF